MGARSRAHKPGEGRWCGPLLYETKVRIKEIQRRHPDWGARRIAKDLSFDVSQQAAGRWMKVPLEQIKPDSEVKRRCVPMRGRRIHRRSSRIGSRNARKRWSTSRRGPASGTCRRPRTSRRP
jgi:hypothetical protein